MPDSIQLVLHKNGERFEFDLWRREVEFGNAGVGDYYWMDGRTIRSRSGGSNLRSCIDFWWACVEEAGDATKVENRINLVLAETYPLVNTSRAMQNVFLDAHLNPKADREVEFSTDSHGRVTRHSIRTHQLSAEDRSRLVTLAMTRDIVRITQELDALFVGDRPSEQEAHAFDHAAQQWIGAGINALSSGGRAGLQNYIQRDLMRWIAKFRKGGVEERVRRFLNVFSYECKAAYYRCYANSWAFLLPVLRNQHGLNDNGLRFMSLWHYQNQPVEVDGQVIHPFSGQVLSLHPLSAVVLTDPGHLAAIGRWIGHSDFERFHDEGEDRGIPEYWEFVATILIAAREYRESHERWEASRGKTTTASSTIGEWAPQEAPTISIGDAFESYAESNSLCCDECAGPLRYESHMNPDMGSDVCRVTFICDRCNHEQTAAIQFEDLRTSLRTDD